MAKRKKKQAPEHPSNAQRFLARLANSYVPFLNTLAFAYLERQLRTGDPRSAVLLARGLDTARSTRIRSSIHKALEKVSQTACINALWREERQTRSTALAEILKTLNQPATAPPEVRAFSLLRLNRLKQLEDAPPELILPLIQACEDGDPQVATAARKVIGHLQKADALDILCAHWARTRVDFLARTIQDAGYLAQNPIDVRVLTALKFNQPDQIDTGSAEVVAPLIQAIRDRDTEIANRADYLLRHALSGAALTEFCLRWSQSRDTQLETILLQSSLLPRQPAPLRLLCALKLNQLEITQKCPPRNLELLLSACQDADQTIRSNANSTLRSLQSAESREALCQIFLASGDDEARQAALDAGYLPASPEQRALFLFLTAQWQAYETLDFDQRIMRAIYDTASAELRQRLARTVQSAGRIEYLNILTGIDYRQRVVAMDDSETSLVIQMLSANQNWEKLWLLAQEFPFTYSVQILKLLSASGWIPRPPDERVLFQRLTGLITRPMPDNLQALAAQLPDAVPLATLKIHGRVNAVAFAPDQPVLALATGSRKVVLWNYQHGQVSQVLKGFDHSVGQVTFLPDGQMVCAERTNGTSECNLIGFDGQEPYRFGMHAASVTVLHPLPDGTLLTAGRDQKIRLWQMAKRNIIGELDVADWPRCAAVSPDGRLAAFMGEHVNLVELPGLQPLIGLPPISTKGARIPAGVARCACFALEGSDLLTGQMNGQVVHYMDVNALQRRRKRRLALHNGAAVGICFLPQHSLVITAGSEGELLFIQWPSGEVHSQIKTPLSNLTSLEISKHGEFMATGSAENAFVLWDLRTQDLPTVMALPLGRFQPENLAAVESLVQVKEIPEAVRNAMHYLQAILQHRYRFDIQIAEIQRIRPGEFDILVDETVENSG
jgi:WD40 repeat protein